MLQIDIGDAFKDRQSGRTTRMIESIPEEGALIIVSDYHLQSIKQSIFEVKGPIIANRCNVVWYKNFDGLKGLSGPVLIDHAVWDSTDITLQEVLQLNKNIAMLRDRPKLSFNKYRVSYSLIDKRYGEHYKAETDYESAYNDFLEMMKHPDKYGSISLHVSK